MNIQAALAAEREARSQRTQVTADAVVQQLARIAFGTLAVLFDDQGRLKHLHDLPPDAQAVVGAIDVVTKKTVSKGNVVAVEYVQKIKARDAVRALELLMRHLGLLTGSLPPGPQVETFVMPEGTHVRIM